MIVCIAEKPSVAKDIARIIGATTARDGYMEGNGYQVTWTFGHLCELKEPDDYTPMWKHWSLSALPMIPQRFGIKLINDEGIKKQFATIEKLMQAADCIINCGDAGQEGELIQRWVMQKAQAKCPVKRLWISSMTDEAIKQGFQELKDQTEYQSLYLAWIDALFLVNTKNSIFVMRITVVYFVNVTCTYSSILVKWESFISGYTNISILVFL